MKLFTITILAILAYTMDGSLARAGDAPTIGQLIMNPADPFVEIMDDESMDEATFTNNNNICTGNIERACNNLCKSNDNELKFSLTLKTDAYNCLCPNKDPIREKEPRSQCGVETNKACKEFCTLLLHKKYTCNEYGRKEHDCICQ